MPRARHHHGKNANLLTQRVLIPNHTCWRSWRHCCAGPLLSESYWSCPASTSGRLYLAGRAHLRGLIRRKQNYKPRGATFSLREILQGSCPHLVRNMGGDGGVVVDAGNDVFGNSLHVERPGFFNSCTRKL